MKMVNLQNFKSKNIKTKIAAWAAASVFAISAFSVCNFTQSASANSAATWWTGTYIQGVYPLNDCPLEVESENLTFNITDFVTRVDGADAYVTAEYNFYNPTAEDITARLVFPFSTLFDYYYDLGFDVDMYGATVNGEDAGAELRFNYHEYSGYDDFEFETDVALLSDDKKEDEYFSVDTVLTPVTFAVPEFTNSSMDPYTYISGSFDDSMRAIYPDTSYHAYDKTDGILTLRHSGTGEFIIYFAGGVPQDISAYSVPWRANANGNGNYLDEDSRTEVTFVVGETVTFGEYVQSLNPFTGAYAENDWYNFSLDFINNYYGYNNYGVACFLNDYDSEYIGEYLLFWYDYQLEVPAGGYTVNTVTAPLYPDMFTNYDPKVYEYTYYLSPAATWADFGNLTVTINTPYYIVGGSLEFTQSGSEEEGFVYTATSEGLPDGELTFKLCQSQNPTTTTQRYYTASERALIYAAIALGIILVAAAVAVTVVLCSRRSKKKR